MKRCPTCQRTYDDTQTFCIEDGAVLMADYGTMPTGNPTGSRPEPPPTVFAPLDALYPSGDYVPPEPGLGREPSNPSNPYAPPASQPGGYNTPSQPGYAPPSSQSGGYNSPSQPGYAPPPSPGYAPGNWQDRPSAAPPDNYAPMVNPYAAPPVPNSYAPPPVPNYSSPQASLDQSLAIASVVCGGLSFVCFGMLLGIPAIITGVMARNRIKQDPTRYTGAGLAMAGMVLGGISTALSLLWIFFMIIGAIAR